LYVTQVISTGVENTTCGDAVGWTALPVGERASVSGERESNLLLFDSNTSFHSRTARDVSTSLDMTNNKSDFTKERLLFSDVISGLNPAILG